MRVKLGKQPIVPDGQVLLRRMDVIINNGSHYHRIRPLSQNMAFENFSTSADRVKFPLPRLFSSHPFTRLSSAANSFFIRPSVRRGQSGWPTFRRQSGVTRRNRGREGGKEEAPDLILIIGVRKLGRSDRVRRVRMGWDRMMGGIGGGSNRCPSPFAVTLTPKDRERHRATVAG